MTSEKKIESNNALKEIYKNKKSITLTANQTRKLTRGKSIYLIIHKQGYTVSPFNIPKELRKYSKQQLKQFVKAL